MKRLRLIDYDGMVISDVGVDNLSDMRIATIVMEVTEAYDAQRGDMYFQMLEDGHVVDRFPVPMLPSLLK